MNDPLCSQALWKTFQKKDPGTKHDHRYSFCLWRLELLFQSEINKSNLISNFQGTSTSLIEPKPFQISRRLLILGDGVSTWKQRSEHPEQAEGRREDELQIFARIGIFQRIVHTVLTGASSSLKLQIISFPGKKFGIASTSLGILGKTYPIQTSGNRRWILISILQIPVPVRGSRHYVGQIIHL